MVAMQHEVSQLDRAALEAFWMPYSGNRQFKDNPRMIVAADGCYYIDRDGRRLFDGLAGLWCVPFGHGRQEFVDAIGRQVAQMDYAPGFQYGHPLSFQLANRVKDLTPDNLDYVFFCNSGSEAADTSMKMVRGYWRLKGQASKTKIIGRGRAYHGVNYGGTSVGGIGPNRKMFGALHDVDHLRATLLPENQFTKGVPEFGAHIADELEEIIALHDASNIAAVMIEPMAGSGGVIVPPRGYLQRIREICDKHDILLIFDEVITGFGRLGDKFGADYFGVNPDVMNLAKGLTNGVIPMGAVVATAEIYRTYMDHAGPDYLLEFTHGYTYSAHPVACAAGLVAMDIFEQQRMWEKAAALGDHLEATVHELQGHPYVTDIRNCGLAAAIQLEALPGEPARRPFEVAMHCWENGMVTRYGGDCISIAPSFIAEKSDIDDAITRVSDAIKALA